MKIYKNIFMIVLVSMILLMIVPSISAEASNNRNQNNDIPDHSRVVDLGNGLMRYDHVHYAKNNGVFINNAITEPDGSIYDFSLMGVKWKTTENFVVNPTDSGLDENDVSGIIATSLNTWDEQVNYNVFGDVSIDYNVKQKPRYDEKNAVMFNKFRPEVIAVSYTYWYTGTDEIIESDVLFNTRFTWGTSGVPDKMDLQNIATHEFGHSAGLLDLYEDGHTELTMYGYSDYGETYKQTLGYGDILGIQALYGE